MASSNLTLHLTTFNAGRELVHVDYFAACLASSLPALPPDLVVLCLQELAPIGQSFLGGRLLAPFWTRVVEAVQKGVRGKYEEAESEYEIVIMRNVGLTGLVLFVKAGLKSQIEWMEEAGTGCGHWDMGNKGAVGVRVKFEGVEMPCTFVAAHLAPMEENWEKRNMDWKRICETLVFEGTEGGRKGITPGGEEEEERLLSATSASNEGASSRPHTLFHPHSHLFFAGDLNYRTSDTPPDPVKDFQTWPHPLSSQPNDQVFKSLFANDQLTRELNRETTLHSLTESAITFPPTYKYSSAASTFASDSSQTIITALKEDAEGSRVETFPGLQMESVAGQNWVWAKHRIPSWCDRILYSKNAQPKDVKLYTALPVQPTSDHRPVVLVAEIERSTTSSAGNEEVAKLFKIQPDWKAQRAAARRYEVMVGVGAYLALTGEGETLLAGSVVGLVGGYLVLSALLGAS